jgi:hypothetical protein
LRQRRTASEHQPRQAGIDESFSDWALPPFVRADLVATRRQRVYAGIALSVFVLAASAVTTVAMIEIYWPKHHGWILVEVVFTLLVLALVRAAHWKRLHERWISSRSLAESLRSHPSWLYRASEIQIATSLPTHSHPGSSEPSPKSRSSGR